MSAKIALGELYQDDMRKHR